MIKWLNNLKVKIIRYIYKIDKDRELSGLVVHQIVANTETQVVSLLFPRDRKNCKIT